MIPEPRVVSKIVVPGLLQTQDYTRAVIESGITERSTTEVEKRVRARMARQTLLSRPNAPEFRAVIGEAVLRQEVGGKEVMREQFQKLLDVPRLRPNVTLQVLPFGVGASIGLEGQYRPKSRQL